MHTHWESLQMHNSFFHACAILRGHMTPIKTSNNISIFQSPYGLHRWECEVFHMFFSYMQPSCPNVSSSSSSTLRKTRLLLRTLELNQIANDIRLQSINPSLLCTSYHSIPYQNNKALRSVRAEWITDDTNSESDSAERGERVCVCVGKKENPENHLAFLIAAPYPTQPCPIN